MADDKKNVGRDRGRVAAGQAYELNYFKRKHGLTDDQARKIIKEAGNSREEANALAEKRKKG
ncbi:MULTISPECIES: DUF3606 domain-containing protein [Ensifer]|uniref:DUF3606 domain-containing protein n=1 Tax=Ensifer TaxID=106591 RepID=UPI0007151B51|nr:MULTISPECIES: DUF3606 domain-containing protein [Ensifer]KQX52269.1 hypothetical protein ASD49_30545 [Ensifer sp. Root1298]KQX85471.1 hypothetical protein ASD41_29915 [Ensifer sp. Root1312]KRC24630.1 hypothetical protein ASE29_26950 [Ensifer sp. Root74]KRD76133.1 hypothetical protein ASE71_03215 [Ensifer sp. Root954]UTV40520.1 DUF3606 domain-containing protein [Ensifer adhaerens]